MTRYGGGINNAGTLTVTNSTIDNNSAIDGGGGIDNAGTLTVTNSTIADNARRRHLQLGTLTVTNSTIDNNDGGGISERGHADGHQLHHRQQLGINGMAAASDNHSAR